MTSCSARTDKNRHTLTSQSLKDAAAIGGRASAFRVNKEQDYDGGNNCAAHINPKDVKWTRQRQHFASACDFQISRKALAWPKNALVLSIDSNCEIKTDGVCGKGVPLAQTLKALIEV